MGAPIINAAEFAAFVLVLLRLSTMMVMAPIFKETQIPAQAKAALALALTFFIAPMVKYNAAMMPMTWLGFVFVGFGEIFIGFTLSFMVRVVLEVAYVAGAYLSMQMGLSMVNAMDPAGTGQTPTLGILNYVFWSLIFLYANGHLLVFKAVVESFSIAPPGFLNIWNPEIFQETIWALAGMYVLALKISAPVLATLFCCQVAFGITAKAIPQMNIMFIGIPIYILVGFVILGFSLEWWPNLMSNALIIADEALGRLLEFFRPLETTSGAF